MEYIRIIDAHSPEHMAEFTVTQLRSLALSTRPEHVVAGYAALLELVRRGEDLPAVRPKPVPLSGCTCGGIGDTGAHRPGCPWSAR